MPDVGVFSARDGFVLAQFYLERRRFVARSVEVCLELGSERRVTRSDLRDVARGVVNVVLEPLYVLSCDRCLRDDLSCACEEENLGQKQQEAGRPHQFHEYLLESKV